MFEIELEREIERERERVEREYIGRGGGVVVEWGVEGVVKLEGRGLLCMGMGSVMWRGDGGDVVGEDGSAAQRRWYSGSIRPCHGRDPSSILGRRNLFPRRRWSWSWSWSWSGSGSGGDGRVKEGVGEKGRMCVFVCGR